MFRVILGVLLIPLQIMAEPTLVTKKSLDSRDPQRICKELNWKLAARKCGKSAQKFDQRIVYNCQNQLKIITQVQNVPLEDAGASGPHRSCAVTATRDGQALWARRYRIYFDRWVSEQDQYEGSGALTRTVITPEGKFIVKKNFNESIMQISGKKTGVIELEQGSYFAFIQGKRSFADLKESGMSRQVQQGEKNSPSKGTVRGKPRMPASEGL